MIINDKPNHYTTHFPSPYLPDAEGVELSLYDEAEEKI
jgi:hypothetical protein